MSSFRLLLASTSSSKHLILSMVRQHRKRYGLSLLCCAAFTCTACNSASPDGSFKSSDASFAPPKTAFVSHLLATSSSTTIATTSCEEAPPQEETSSLPPPPAVYDDDIEEEEEESNPLWPSGISEQDVDNLVDEVINDPTINIQSIPDSLERQIYRSTILLFLNSVYHSLSQVHNSPILGHELKLERWKAQDWTHDRIEQHYLSFIRGDVDEEMLEEVADRLLANKAINQRFLPDVIERKLYVNCLKLVFRLMGMFAASLRVTVCGHAIRLKISKATRQAIQQSAIQRATSSMTEIDTERLREFAAEAGIRDDEVDPRHLSLFERLIEPSRREFMIKLHASLYGLILGILDDLLANTKVELLSDRVSFDIVPATERRKRAGETTIEADREEKALSVKKEESPSTNFLPVVSFTAGVGVGLVLTTLIGRN